MEESHFRTKDIAKAFILLVSLLIVWLIIFGPPGSKRGLFWGEIKNEDEFWAKERQYKIEATIARSKTIALEQVDTYLVNNDLTYSKDSKITVKNVSDSDIKTIEIKTLLKDNIVEIFGQEGENLKFTPKRIQDKNIQLMTIYFKKSLAPEETYQFHISSKYPKLRTKRLFGSCFSYLPFLRYQIFIDTTNTADLYVYDKRQGMPVTKLLLLTNYPPNNLEIMETGIVSVSLFSKK